MDEWSVLLQLSCLEWDPWVGSLCTQGTHLWNGYRQAPSAPGIHTGVCSVLRARWPYLFPRFLSYSCRNSELLAYHLQDLAGTCLGDLNFYSSPVLMSKVMKGHSKSQWRGTLWFFPRGAAIAIRERSDSQATQRPASPPPPLHSLLRVYPTVHGGFRVYPLTSSSSCGYNQQPQPHWLYAYWVLSGRDVWNWDVLP